MGVVLPFALSGGMLGSAMGAELNTLTPESIDLKATRCGSGWRKWESIGNIEGMSPGREQLTSLAATDHDVWVGTSRGRVLTLRGDNWSLQGQLKGIQITGIAVDGPDKVWISTSDGIMEFGFVGEDEVENEFIIFE
jgi:hypothetical protein